MCSSFVSFVEMGSLHLPLKPFLMFEYVALSHITPHTFPASCFHLVKLYATIPTPPDVLLFLD